MRNKSWPYWEEWKEIFGHDRANGKNAEDVLEFVNELQAHDNIGNMGVDGDYHANLEDIFVNENVPNSAPNETTKDDVCQGKRDNPPLKRCSKKRKVDDGMDAFHDLFSKMHKENNS
ncbi:hypothetical protein AAHA92_12146 [Salvia divinorum]|uniref:Uncharacterized protein n=1 Tax=Salvia divinorum TaxID=28513 RepID=A0ABD1HJB7_SALDI